MQGGTGCLPSGMCDSSKSTRHSDRHYSEAQGQPLPLGPSAKLASSYSSHLARPAWLLAPSSLCVFSHMQVGNHAISDGHQYKKLLPFLPLEVGVGGCVWGEEDKWGLELKSHTSWLCHSTPLELFFYILI